MNARACVWLALVVGCGEPWVTLGQRASVDGATPAGSTPEPDAALSRAPSSDDAAAGAASDGSTRESDAGRVTPLPVRDAALDGRADEAEHSCADGTPCESGGHPFCDVLQGLCVRCLRDLDCDAQDSCLAGDCVSRN